MVDGAAALNEGRGSNPSDTLEDARRGDDDVMPLNEGRGSNPSDTGRARRGAHTRPRRSTKAGARTPATRVVPSATRCAPDHAQRSPGLEPQRHPPCSPTCSRSSRSLNEGRGSNPSDTPARRGSRESPPSLNEVRGSNPSDTSPHTLAARSAHPLNEGRGSNPSDTGVLGQHQHGPAIAQRRPGLEPQRHRGPGSASARAGHRSTKAGARTPATPRALPAAASRRARSTKAGARTPATPLRGGREPDRAPRSTKAGARTPATRHGLLRPAPLDGSLNEGRGSNPSDTSPRSPSIAVVWPRSTKAGARTPATLVLPHRGVYDANDPLNEGRGSNPSDTTAIFQGVTGLQALNEGRGSNPSDTWPPIRPL